MTTIHFICGMGVGALLTTVFFLILLVILFRYMGRTRTEQQAKADQQHAELSELHRKRTEGINECAKYLKTVHEWCLQRWTPK